MKKAPKELSPQQKLAQRYLQQQKLIAEQQRAQAAAEVSAWNDNQNTDRQRGVGAHDPAAKNANFDQKLYFFPPHFNYLREELYNNWQDTHWPRVSWFMANSAEDFIAEMNDITGLSLGFDSDKVDWTCEQFLLALRKMRGAA